jgi:hypothetical protein
MCRRLVKSFLGIPTGPRSGLARRETTLVPPHRRNPVVTRGTPSRWKGCLPAGRGR